MKASTDPIPIEEERAVAAFVLDEARLLDEGRFEDWLTLFADDGVYWVPGQPGQVSPAAGLSLYHEAKSLLALRMRRLAQHDAPVHTPPSRTLHHVGALRVLRSIAMDTTYDVHGSLIIAEYRNETARWFAARTLHRLRHEAAGLRIVLKQVNLIDCDAPHRALAVPF